MAQYTDHPWEEKIVKPASDYSLAVFILIITTDKPFHYSELENTVNIIIALIIAVAFSFNSAN